MQKRHTKRARMTHRAVVAAMVTFAATSAFALGTGRAVGTPLVEPAQKLDAQTCLSCHTTVKKLQRVRPYFSMLFLNRQKPISLLLQPVVSVQMRSLKSLQSSRNWWTLIQDVN